MDRLFNGAKVSTHCCDVIASFSPEAVGHTSAQVHQSYHLHGLIGQHKVKGQYWTCLVWVSRAQSWPLGTNEPGKGAGFSSSIPFFHSEVHGPVSGSTE